MTIREEVFRKAMGGFPSGVTIITAREESGTPIGVTVSAFCSLSLDPPMVLFCLGKATTGLEVYRKGPVCVSILAADQAEVSARFAKRGIDRFAGLTLEEGTTGIPAPAGSVARLDCSVVETVAGGDHWVVMARVDQARIDPDTMPLVYCRGSYHGLGGVPPAAG